MPAVAVDTHAAIWYLTLDLRLSDRATSVLDGASAAGDPIHVPTICLVELTYLVEKGRVPVSSRDQLTRAIDAPNSPFQLAPLDRSVINVIEFISRDAVPDLPDRVITATALALRVPLVTCDEKIRASGIETIW